MNHTSPFGPSTSTSYAAGQQHSGWSGLGGGSAFGDGSMSAASSFGARPSAEVVGSAGGPGGIVSVGSNPFGTHKFVPIPGAPGFRPDEYDWDKGYSDELDRALGGGGSGSATPKSYSSNGSGGQRAKAANGGQKDWEKGKEVHRGRKRDKEKESGPPALYQTISSKLGFGWGSSGPSSASSSASLSPYQRQANTVPATRQSGFMNEKRSATEPRKGVGELIERMVGGVELEGRKESTISVLSERVSSLLRPHLPPLSRLPRTWNLLYSLDQHGISLNTLYTQCEAPEKTRKPNQSYIGMAGSIFIIQDADASSSFIDGHEEKSVFGAFIAEGIGRKTKGFYGGGDSFLFSYSPIEDKMKVFKPTGRNSYFVICDQDYVGFGGGGTGYGIWVDSGLLDGSSARSVTFGNDVLCSAGRPGAGGEVDFELVGLEVWGIGPS